MKVQVLGTGCAKCKKTEEHARQAIAELGLDADLVKVTDLNDILEFNVMMTPALAVDGEVKVSGRVPSVAVIKGFLTQ